MKPIRYAGERGSPVRTLPEHAFASASAILARVEQTGSPSHRVLDPVLETFLREAYEAGRREGCAYEASRAGESMTERVRTALAFVRTEPAECPHCDRGKVESIGGQRPCEECGGTGNYRK